MQQHTVVYRVGMPKLVRNFSMQMLSAVTELGKAKRFHVDTSKWAEALPEAITLVVWPKHVFAFLADKFQLLTGSKHTGAAAFTSLLYEHQVLKTGRPLAPLPAILQKSSRGIGVKADWLDSIQQTYSLYLACIKPKSSHAVPGKLSWQVQCLICCCSCQFLVLSYHCWRFDTLRFGHMMQS